MIFPYRYAYFALFWPLTYKYLSVSLPMVNYFHYLKGRTQAYRYISLHIANLEKLKNMCFLLRKRDFPFFCDMYIFRSVSTYCSFSFKRSLDAHMCIPNLKIERTVSTCLAGYLLTLFPKSYYAKLMCLPDHGLGSGYEFSRGLWFSKLILTLIFVSATAKNTYIFFVEI